jgi:hypothetical protein
VRDRTPTFGVKLPSICGVLALPSFTEKGNRLLPIIASLRTCATPIAKLKPVHRFCRMITRFGSVITHSGNAITCFGNAEE